MKKEEVGRFRDVLAEYKVHLLVALVLMGALYSSALPSMVVKWYQDPNYSHGFIVPLVSGYAVYRRLDEIKETAVAPADRGLLLIVAALLLFVVASVVAENFSVGLSFVMALGGIVLYLFGRKVFGLLLFPLGYLFFMVPLPYAVYDSIAFPLKLFIAKYSVILLKVMGVVVWREGNIIMFPNAVFEVADACSGIRSLMSLVALGVAFAYFTQKSFTARCAVTAAAVPIAVIANGLRVVITGMLARYWGAQAAEGFFHEFAGIAVFGIAVAMLMLAGVLIKRLAK